ERPNLRLAQVAQRELGRAELVLREAREEVRLVLRLVDRAQQPRARPVALDARVVAGHDALGAERARPRDELLELESVVARDARDGRAARDVARDEGRDDLAIEALAQVHDVVRQPE